MVLTNKEKMISVISNGIAVFSLLQERDELPKNTSMYDFVTDYLFDDICLYFSLVEFINFFGYKITDVLFAVCMYLYCVSH